jgi:lysophospholipase L1-like esterase
MDSSQRNNRFARHPVITSLVILLFLIMVAECLSYVVIVAVGHRDRRRNYPYNRVVSGYTVFRNTPEFNNGSSTIRLADNDPDAKLDEHGFLVSKPIKEEKQSNTVRIFVQGGSAAFGAGQNVNYHSVHAYPDGVYSYPLSIAGQLQTILEQQFPDVTFEVINAASYARVYHQSMLQYVEQISRYQPDYVISLDGWNDITTFTLGRPFKVAERMLPEFIALDRKAHSVLRRSNTFYVLATAFDKLRVRRNKSVQQMGKARRDISEGAYQTRRESFAGHAERFEQIVRQYLAVTKSDETKYIFVLQPMLPRANQNKALSEIEKKLLAHTLEASWMKDENLLVARYFFDDYLAPRLASLCAEHDAWFIDGNREIEDLDSSTEFFTDYCHLTAEGNRILAQRIGQRIIQDLNGK